MILTACGTPHSHTPSDVSAQSATKDTPERSDTPFDASPVTPEYPLVTEPAALSLLFPLQDEEISEGTKALFSAFAETTGITLSLNPLPNANYSMDINTMIASGEIPDLIMSAPEYMMDTELSDFLMPLNDLISEFAPNYIRAANNCHDGILSLVENSGNVMQLYRFFDEPRLTPSLGAVIRADWLEELGMEPPETYDDYYQLLTAMKNQYNPKLPFYLLPTGVTGGDNFSAGFGVSLGSNSAFNGFFQRDGVVKYGILEEGFTDYVTMMRDWLDQGLITPVYTDLVDLGSNSYLIDLSTGKSGVFFVPASAYKTLEGMCEFPITPGMDPVLNAGDVSHLANSRATSIYGSGLSIPEDCGTPELAMQAADWFYSEEAVQIGKYGTEEMAYSVENETPEFAEITLKNLNRYTTDMQGIILNSRVELALENYVNIFSVWNQQKDSAYMLPPISLTLDEDEIDRYEQIMLDVGTYSDGCVAQLINGDMPISEIPNVQAKLKEMDIEEVIDILQRALDNYF